MMRLNIDSGVVKYFNSIIIVLYGLCHNHEVHVAPWYVTHIDHINRMNSYCVKLYSLRGSLMVKEKIPQPIPMYTIGSHAVLGVILSSMLCFLAIFE